jgi:hypothetical protein
LSEIFTGTFQGAPGEGNTGNDCSGVFGTDPNCDVGYYLNGESGFQVDDEDDAAISPLIFKDNIGGTDSINPLFSTIDGTEFVISYNTGVTSSGSWTYTRMILTTSRQMM